MISVNKYFVYFYEHDDDLRGWIPVEDFRYPNWDKDGEEEAMQPEDIQHLKDTLKQCGWEGDGKLGAMMVPPFFSNVLQTSWFPVFHVKQSNNGTSWIASGFELNTENLTRRSTRSGR